MLVFVSPLGFVALESGWVVTELGRQPWTIYHLMRTKDAVTSMPNVTFTFLTMTAVYMMLGVIVVWLLSKHVIAVPDTEQVQSPEVLV